MWLFKFAIWDWERPIKKESIIPTIATIAITTAAIAGGCVAIYKHLKRPNKNKSKDAKSTTHD